MSKRIRQKRIDNNLFAGWEIKELWRLKMQKGLITRLFYLHQDRFYSIAAIHKADVFKLLSLMDNPEFKVIPTHKKEIHLYSYKSNVKNLVKLTYLDKKRRDRLKNIIPKKQFYTLKDLD